MITTSQSIIALSAALLKFQSEATGVYRDGKNPHFKSKYATLENVIDTARPVLQSAGLVFIQGLGAVNDNTVEVTTRLIHAESGEWMESTLQMPLGKRDPQGTGSACTYGLRYSLMAMLGMPPSDDDAESATNRNTPQQNNQSQHSQQSKSDTRPLYSALETSMRENMTRSDLSAWWKDSECIEKRNRLPKDWQETLKQSFQDYGLSLPAENKDAA